LGLQSQIPERCGRNRSMGKSVIALGIYDFDKTRVSLPSFSFTSMKKQ
jgi:hypothetical protein